jgi:hypothetical protein
MGWKKDGSSKLLGLVCIASCAPVRERRLNQFKKDLEQLGAHASGGQTLHICFEHKNMT